MLVRGEKVASAQDFGWQSKGDGHFGDEDIYHSTRVLVQQTIFWRGEFF